MKDDYSGVLLEDIRDQLQKFAEAMSGVPKDVARLKEDMLEVKDNIKAIKAAVTDQSRQLGNHETRISSLETA